MAYKQNKTAKRKPTVNRHKNPLRQKTQRVFKNNLRIIRPSSRLFCLRIFVSEKIERSLILFNLGEAADLGIKTGR